jgi:hypothetical protein
MLTTLQGLSVLELRLTRPLVGLWVATLEVDHQDAEELYSGPLELKDERITYQGTKVQGGVISGVARLDVVGGTGGLLKPVPPRHFREVTVKALVESLLSLAGEQLDATSTATVLSRTLPFWSWGGDGLNERASRHLTSITDKLGVSWRVLPNGKVWVGIDAWNPADEDINAIELDRDDADGNVLLATESLELGPGVSLAGRHVGRTEHTFGRQESLRTTFWVEP